MVSRAGLLLAAALAQPAWSQNVSSKVPSYNCLCMFDLDRTLTGKQGSHHCPSNQVEHGIYDKAYGGGTLSLSAAAVNLGKTACSACYVGIVAHGDGSGAGSKERNLVSRMLDFNGKLLSTEWSYPDDVTSTLVVKADRHHKADVVNAVLSWMNQERGVVVSPYDVYVFDDRPEDLDEFRGGSINAKEVSCATRDGGKGLCGATVDEITLTQGVHTCGNQHELIV